MLHQVLEEFYENLQSVGVSAATGEGMDEFFDKLSACRKDYELNYLPELQRRQQVRGRSCVTSSVCFPNACRLPWHRVVQDGNSFQRECRAILDLFIGLKTCKGSGFHPLAAEE